MAKSQKTRKSVHVPPVKKKLGRPPKKAVSTPLSQPEPDGQDWAANDLPEAVAEINMPLNLSELNLLGLALQAYRLEIERSWLNSKHATKVVLGAVQKLEAKIESNETSWHSLFDGKLNKG
jgi:hypothetical protein